VLPIFTLGSLGVALARTVPQLMFFRVVQAFGGGGGMSVGAGVISDIYRMEERGSAIGFFFAVRVFFSSLVVVLRAWEKIKIKAD
jgi:MFS family permease